MKTHFNPITNKDGLIVDVLFTSGHMLPGGFAQGIYEQSATQNYTIGTRLVVDDRTFRYCKAATDLKCGYGARQANFPREGNIAAVAYAAGTFEITIPMNDHATLYASEKLANYWAEGYIWIGQFDAKGFGPTHRIKSNTVASGTIPTQYVTATLYEALAHDVAASAWITAHPNIYGNIQNAYHQKASVVCVPPRFITSGYYFWGQTWGPVMMQQTHAAGGLTADDREFFFHENNNGELATGGQCDWSGATNIKHQRAGFLLTNTTAWTNVGDGAEAGGDCFVMLQLSP